MREVSKVSCSLSCRGTLASCLRQEETKDKRVPVGATGFGPLVGKLVPKHSEWSEGHLSSPSSHDVSGSEEESTPESPFVAGRGTPFQGPKLGSCLTLRNELSEETHVLTKQEILLGKGTRVESSRVREPTRTGLLHGSQSRVLW